MENFSKITFVNNPTFRPAMLNHLENRSQMEPQTLVTTVWSNPVEVADRLASAGDPITPHRVFMLPPDSPELNARMRAVRRHKGSAGSWTSLFTKNAVQMAEKWFSMHQSYLPTQYGEVCDTVKCGFTILATAHLQMKVLWQAKNVDTYLFDRDHSVDVVLVADTCEMVTANVSGATATELTDASLIMGRVNLMDIEQRLSLFESQPLTPSDFEIKMGSRMSRAADWLVRSIVEEFLLERGQWRPTYYPDIAAEPFQFGP